MEYRFDDRALHAEEFLRFVNQVWPGDYDPARTEEALGRTICLTVRDNGMLVGCLRILTDGYFFGTITELLVLPEYQRQGSAVRFWRWQNSIPRPCSILEPSPRQSSSMSGTAAGRACSPTRSISRKPADPQNSKAGHCDYSARLFVTGEGQRSISGQPAARPAVLLE